MHESSLVFQTFITNYEVAMYSTKWDKGVHKVLALKHYKKTVNVLLDSLSRHVLIPAYSNAFLNPVFHTPE